ncbi:MAG: alpha/beta hydrolase-fold protein [Pseudomonadales bacterium]|nr:alpha/beta hydrolase-fold protein [Pseudomonadales bacterium]
MQTRAYWITRLGILLLLTAGAQAQLPPVPGLQNDQAPQPDPDAPMYRQTGEQYRVYDFPGTGEAIPYRLFVPETWTPEQRLPVLITLRAGTSVNNSHREGNDLVREARARGYIVISPLGYRPYRQPYYGSPYPVDRPAGPSVPAQGWTAEENQRAEQDVLYVLGLVSAEYNADPARVFVHGQNPSASGAFHLAAKYPERIRAIVASSGPIVTTDYPFAALRGKVAVLMIHRDRDTQNTMAASQRVVRELQAHGVEAEYATVPGGEHLTAYLGYAGGIFDFLDRHK